VVRLTMRLQHDQHVEKPLTFILRTGTSLKAAPSSPGSIASGCAPSTARHRWYTSAAARLQCAERSDEVASVAAGQSDSTATVGIDTLQHGMSPDRKLCRPMRVAI
jgi:hypothetical protein